MSRPLVRSRSRRHPALLPASLYEGLARFVRAIVGGLIMAFAFGLALSLISYDPHDPSFNTASVGGAARGIHNLCSVWGSYSADILWQFFGLGSFILPVVIGAWGWRTASNKGVEMLGWRSLATLCAVSTGGMALAAMKLPPGGLPLEGALGKVVIDALISLLPFSWSNIVLALFFSLVTIIGVMPKTMQYPSTADLYLPLASADAELANRSVHDYLVIGRLRHGVTTQQAQAEMKVIAERLSRQFPATNLGWRVKVEPLLDDINGELTPLYFKLVQGATLFVLLVVCANVANLQFARGIARRPEIAMRLAMGASRSRLLQQLLTETILLGLVGAVGGLIFAQIYMHLSLISMPARVARYMSGWSNISLNGRALLFSFLSAVVVVWIRQMSATERSEAIVFYFMSACAVAGLVAITPASGFVQPFPAMLIGLLAGLVCYFMVVAIKPKLGYDDSLDAFGVHGCGGTLGAILTGVFATCLVNDGLKDAAGKVLPLGLIDGKAGQVVNQLIGVGISWGIAIVGTLIILKICDLTVGVRVTREQEVEGLDLSMHGEEGYIFE